MTKTDSRRKQAGSGMRVLLSLACVIVVVAGLKAAAELFIPVMLGLFLALLSLPILNWLDGKGFPRPLAVFTTILVDLLILGGIVFLASGVIGDFQEKSGDYTERLRSQAAEFSRTMDKQIARFEAFWESAGESIGRLDDPDEPVEPVEPADPGVEPARPGFTPPAETPAEAEEGLVPLVPSITFSKLFEQYWDSSRIVEVVGQFDVVNRFTSFATTTFFALIVMIFVLAESGMYAQKVRDVLHVRGPDLRRFQSMAHDIQKYLAIKTGVSLLTGILATFTCLAFGVDFPLLWGMVAFLFNYVPAIGSIVAGIPPVLLALILYGFWPAAGVLICYLVINIGIGNFLEPMLLGDRFGISTVIVILSVMVWGFIWGPVGMLLAVPLTMLVKVMLDNSSDLRWISALMGKGGSDLVEEEKEEPPEEPAPEGDPEPDAA